MAHLGRARHPRIDLRIDSAGTGSYHVGEPPDRRSVAIAARHGIRLEGRARQVRASDLDRFDLVVAMDRENLRWLKELQSSRGGGRARIVLMRDFDPGPGQSATKDQAAEAPMAPAALNPDVPDPYYGGPEGFAELYHLLERCCEALLAEIAG